MKQADRQVGCVHLLFNTHTDLNQTYRCVNIPQRIFGVKTPTDTETQYFHWKKLVTGRAIRIPTMLKESQLWDSSYLHNG
jgi:hypothetical protein